MTTVVKAHLFPAVLAAIMVFVTLPFIESLFRLYNKTVPAIEWHGVQVETPTIRPGENLRVIYAATVNKQCPSDIRGFLIASDGSVPVRFRTLAGGYARITDGNEPIQVVIPIPTETDFKTPLPSGEYIYRALVTRYCPEGVEDDNNVPDAKFIIKGGH